MCSSNAVLKNRIPAFAGLTAALFALSALPAQASDFDGSESLVCATQEVQTCLPGYSCLHFLPRQVGAPEFIRINFRKKEIRGPKRTTPIRLQERGDGGLILQGTEMGYGWTIGIDTETGSLSASLVDGGSAYALFGACTVQE